MKKNSIVKIASVFLVLTMFSITLGNMQYVSAKPYSQDTGVTHIHQESELTFRSESNNEPAYEEKPTPPDVEDVVSNITSFNETGTEVFLGNDTIPEELLGGWNWTYIQINLTAIYVFDDHDPLDAGDIFFRFAPNYWIGAPDSGWVNYSGHYLDSGEYQIDDSLADWYNFTDQICLFDDYTFLSTMYIEVIDSDPGYDDSLGTAGWWYEDPYEIEGYHEFTLDTGDAIIAVNITILGGDNNITAEDLTELFQPFLFDNDDSSTSDPDALFARIIYGYDNEEDFDSLCIQYLYYWREVYSDSFWGSEFIHNDDYELVQVYLNFNEYGPIAYRWVFDNHHIYTNSPTEWRDSMEYSIFEFNHTETGIIQETINNSESLRPLLGEEYTASYQYKNLSNYISNYASCYGGVPTLLLTVETYNHQFAIGNTGGDILGQYYIDPYNDDVIRECYLLLNDSFTGGVHDINGETAPNYSPFAYDVIQVFTVPYIHSNFDHLMQEAVAFQGETEAKGVKFNMEHSVNVTISLPITVDMDIPNTLTPGEKLNLLLNSTIDPSKAIIVIDYFFNLSVSVDMFFFSKTFSTVISNNLTIDFSNPVLQWAISSLGLDESRSSEHEFLGGMLTVESEFTPTILGEILNCNATFHLVEILKHYFPALSILDFFLDDAYFKINPVLTGYIDGDLQFGDQSQTLRWDDKEKSFALNLTVPDVSSDSTIDMILTNFRYGLNFHVNWIVGVDFTNFINNFIDDKELNLGTWPDLDMELFPLTGGITISLPFGQYAPDINNQKWYLVDSPADPTKESTNTDSSNTDSSNASDYGDVSGSIDGFSTMYIFIVGIVSILGIAKKIKKVD